MKIGLVISGGDVSGINNFIYQVNRMTAADIVIFDGELMALSIIAVKSSLVEIW